MGLTAMARELSQETAEMVENAGEAAHFLKKLAHPSRLMIVCALVDGERSVRDLEDTLGIRQPGLSQQIAELREAVGRKEAKHMFYRLEDGRVAEFISMMHSMFCAKPREGSNP
jgi:DNA-binding transcriptional ArsR family regulator